MHFELNIPPPKLKKTFSAEAWPKLVQGFKATANYIIEIIVKLPTQTVVLRSAQPVLSLSKGFTTHKPAASLPIIWDYVKCFPLLRFLKKLRSSRILANTFSIHFPEAEKDFFPAPTTTLNKEKMRQRSVTSPKEV